MDVFVEGIGAVSQACTLALLIPACAVVLLAGRHSVVAAVAFLAGATVIAWARFTDNWFTTPGGFVALAVGLAVLIAVLLLWIRPQDPFAGPVAMIVGAATGWLWEPCVGEQLGRVINEGPDKTLGTLWGTFLYILGALLVAFAMAVARHAFPQVNRLDRHTILAGGVVSTVIALTMAVGAYDDIVSELVLRSRP